MGCSIATPPSPEDQDLPRGSSPPASIGHASALLFMSPMRTLVTGGAGFVGSHLVRRLLELGDEVVVLDSLDEQVHTTAPVLPDGARFVKGDVGDRAAAADALRGVDRVVHLAAAVGVGQSMYEIARYVDQNTLSTAVFLECLLKATPRPARLVVASSMSIYGEGEYVCATHGHRSPRSTRGDAAAGPRVGSGVPRLRTVP